MTVVAPAVSDRLVERLRREIRGDVRFDAGARALYATDASNYRHAPVGVIAPRDADDVACALAYASEAGVPVLGRGAGTSLAGQTCNEGIVLDFSRYMNAIVDLDGERRLARVQPGVILDALRDAAGRLGLTFGPDPATHQYCTLGGMIANNSCGVRSVMAAHFGPGPTTAHSVESLDVILADGLRLTAGATDDAAFERAVARGGREAALYRELRDFRDRHAGRIRSDFPDIPRRVSGYNLPALLPEHGFHVGRALAGSESTLALTLEATVRLIEARPHRVLVVLGYRDVFAAADAVPEVLTHLPVGLEGFDQGLADDLVRAGLNAQHLELLPDGGGWLLAEFGGTTPEEARDRATACVRAARDGDGSVAVYDDPEQQAQLWEVRESGLAATARVSGRHPTWPGFEDSAVPPGRLGAYLRDLQALTDRFGYHVDLYGHFGQGCVHCRIDFDLRSSEGIERFRQFMEAGADLVHRHGGSLSGEHGDGQARGELLSRMFPPATMEAFREYKRLWDPEGRLNPGRIIDARPIDADLRLGVRYDPPPLETHFRFPDDLGSFAHATLRCVGVGKCRKEDSGTMCPSYMVTRDEQHTTRGRARLLFEMLERRPLAGTWDAEPVHEALDLCLACKGCKGECPVHVDMATYKAEFLAHYYEDHWRPRSAPAFGLIDVWARLVAGTKTPRLVNTLADTPIVGGLLRRAADVAPQRALPAFAPQTFRAQMAARGQRGRAVNGEGPRVLLWPDTFNDNFHPETLVAAVDVLEALDFEVALPPAGLCCGRPLYDYGYLDLARARLARILDALDAEIARGTLLVGIEPGCLSVFRDELGNLFPDDPRASRLREQTRTLAELLDAHADRLDGVRLERDAVVHGHCHQRALSGMDADARVLARLGVRHHVLDSGCCGMAGAFGFEREHYDVSMRVGERVLLPTVREAPADALVIADGFSCREQIAQGTPRQALHLAQVVLMALQSGPRGATQSPPERAYVPDPADARFGQTGRTMLAAGAVGAAAIGLGAIAAGVRSRRPLASRPPAGESHAETRD